MAATITSVSSSTRISATRTHMISHAILLLELTKFGGQKVHCNSKGRPTGPLQILEAGLGIAEVIELDAEAIHERQVQAAHLAVVFTGVEVIQRAAGFERAAESAGENQGQAEIVVLAANPQIR